MIRFDKFVKHNNFTKYVFNNSFAWFDIYKIPYLWRDCVQFMPGKYKIYYRPLKKDGLIL